MHRHTTTCTIIEQRHAPIVGTNVGAAVVGATVGRTVGAVVGARVKPGVFQP